MLPQTYNLWVAIFLVLPKKKKKKKVVGCVRFKSTNLKQSEKNKILELLELNLKDIIK